jgi:hypothetical protein
VAIIKVAESPTPFDTIAIEGRLIPGNASNSIPTNTGLAPTAPSERKTEISPAVGITAKVATIATPITISIPFHEFCSNNGKIQLLKTPAGTREPHIRVSI